jgi:hypothetical protein
MLGEFGQNLRAAGPKELASWANLKAESQEKL